jgi:predicted choloylglycine hydrolase
VEFLWGLSDGINDAGLSIALAYGGRQETGRGFGITTILRYVLETCETVPQALRVLQRVPSHMPYNVVVADASGAAASVEMYAGGGAKVQPRLVATNHQTDGSTPDRGTFTRTFERSKHLNGVLSEGAAPATLVGQFTQAPLKQDRYAEGFGTLFTAEYEPLRRQMTLHWDGDVWAQSLDAFEEGTREVRYGSVGATASYHAGEIDWVKIGMDYAAGRHPDWRRFLPSGVDVA